MEKLTNADRNSLTYFFTTPAPAHLSGYVAAQSYDRGEGGIYDPATDKRIATLMQAAMDRGQGSVWLRVSAALTALSCEKNGRLHYEVLRRAFGAKETWLEDEFAYPSVAEITESAAARGRELAERDERWRLLEVSRTAAYLRGDSAMSIACQVLETDALLDASGIVIGGDALLRNVHIALEEATSKNTKDSAFASAVRAEMYELVDAAGDAYRRARKKIGDAAKERKEDDRRAREKQLERDLGAKRDKETAKYEQKLARMRREKRSA